MFVVYCTICHHQIISLFQKCSCRTYVTIPGEGRGGGGRRGRGRGREREGEGRGEREVGGWER